MNLLTTRYPWQLELLTKEIIDRRSESHGMIDEAMAILTPKYIESIKLLQRNPKNKVLKHNYHLLATLYDLLKYSKAKKVNGYAYHEMPRPKSS
ncbi:MAG: hypothetical protein H0V66_15365 [Bdellovibrionales bacterium]|nr:hypothetical protein [Bdellovibrionales bacterium]